MALTEDERKQIMETIDTRLEHHQLHCPMASSAIQNEHERIMTALFNGEDGKSGVAYELSALITEWRTINKQKQRFWYATAAALTLLVAIMVQPIENGWKDFDALMKLADKAPTIIKLTEDWERYYATPPAVPPFTVAPQDSQPKKADPGKPKHSYFEHGGGISFNQQPPPLDAGIPPLQK